MRYAIAMSSPMLAGCLAAALALPAMAAAETPGRYTISPTEGGFVRLDRESGAMSFCSGKEASWSCTPMADGEQKLKRRIEELESENRALREHSGPQAGTPGAEGAPSDSVPPGPQADIPIPTERDVDKLFDYVEAMVKKFKERMQRLEKKEETPL